jgi:hypothetical protein
MKRPFGNLGVDSIRIDVREIKWECVESTHLPQDRDQ